jgi:hypothetical protein
VTLEEQVKEDIDAMREAGFTLDDIRAWVESVSCGTLDVDDQGNIIRAV